MSAAAITGYMTQFGLIAVFIIVFLEYLNLPGFPAGIIMPAAGICASQGGFSFVLTLVISVAAGLLGSWLLYFLGRLGGLVFINWFSRRFPKQTGTVDKTINFVNDKGMIGIFFAKLLPSIRTLISIPAGLVKMDFWGYTFFSLMGIVVWNLVFIGAGFFLGDTVFALLG